MTHNLYKGTDLDAPQSPDAIPNVLRRAAQKMHEQAAELGACWQDGSAGRSWSLIARELECCADKIEKKIS